MRRSAFLCLCVLAGAHVLAQDAPRTEAAFRHVMGLPETARLAFRGVDCNPVTYEAFSEAMRAPEMKSEVDRAVDGTAVTLTVRRRGGHSCPAPYPPVTEMPPFELRDLAGKRVTAGSLKGKPTLMNFYFAQCVPCILEVGPINRYAAQHPEMNFLAVTFDEPAVARAFVDRYKFRWRVVPGAQEFIDRVRVKKYPMMVLFDSRGRLLGMKPGGVRDELEAANVGPQLTRWVDGLLRVNQQEAGALGER
ncbi:MAG TPA: TlpA disulfide reductase family protein [Steroidobacteraceae bacterium]|nr:TlpA disulfide reductase family protein [Steroidobacteraceae bacterium]